jgi:hypothetical protein
VVKPISERASVVGAERDSEEKGCRSDASSGGFAAAAVVADEDGVDIVAMKKVSHPESDDRTEMSFCSLKSLPGMRASFLPSTQLTSLLQSHWRWQR